MSTARADKLARANGARSVPPHRVLWRLPAQELAQLQSELPTSTLATIHGSDVDFPKETIRRRQQRLHRSSHTLRRTAAGIAWERVLSARVNQLADAHTQLRVLAERWRPAKARTDLDLIVEDSRKTVIWIIDAKLSSPDNDQFHKMRHQIALLRRDSGLTGGCPTILGIIVHDRRQLPVPYTPTDDPHIHRCTLQQLANLLLARRLPCEQIFHCSRHPHIGNPCDAHSG